MSDDTYTIGVPPPQDLDNLAASPTDGIDGEYVNIPGYNGKV
jgi:hypothetical protein